MYRCPACAGSGLMATVVPPVTVTLALLGAPIMQEPVATLCPRCGGTGEEHWIVVDAPSESSRTWMVSRELIERTRAVH